METLESMLCSKILLLVVLDNFKLIQKSQYVVIDDEFIFKAEKASQSFLLINQIFELLKFELKDRNNDFIEDPVDEIV